MNFDLARAVKEGCRTRDGRPVRIICTDRAESHYRVVALLLTPDAGAPYEEVVVYTGMGKTDSGGDGPYDLVNLPEAHEVTVRLFDHGNGLWASRVLLDGELIHQHSDMHDTEREWGKPVTVRIENDA